MVKTYLYIPDELQKRITLVAKKEKLSKAEVMRRSLEKGIVTVSQGNASARALLKVAEVGKKYRPKGPKDLSKNLDAYLWKMKKKK